MRQLQNTIFHFPDAMVMAAAAHAAACGSSGLATFLFLIFFSALLLKRITFEKGARITGEGGEGFGLTTADFSLDGHCPRSVLTTELGSGGMLDVY